MSEELKNPATTEDPDPRCDICGSHRISAGGGCVSCHDDYAPGHGLGEEKPETAKEASDE